ncbi:MAG TPA: CHAP domain-containing protein [Acidimicrobiales bacterium]|nr:CHAP domain-containing protein [Acidimicrobiales bacterium]
MGGSLLAATNSTAYSQPRVTSIGTILQPSWWHGLCDGGTAGAYPGSYALGARWDGLVACGPGPNEGGSDATVQFFPGAWGEYEWECVELSMRWMYLAWGVPPYPANGNSIADNYAADNPNGPTLQLVKNGTRGEAPQPGDVLEMHDSSGYGHTEVVTSSQVNVHGNGTVRAITENLDSPTNGWQTLTVSDWVVNAGFGTVVDWLHNPNWSLEEPLVSNVTSAGGLVMKQGMLRGGFQQVATGVAQAEVIGGGGSEPAPILVVRTTSGALEARYDLPGAPWWTLASSGVTDVESGVATGPEGRAPVIGWRTSAGAFFLQTGGLAHRPVKEATGVASIAVASATASGAPLVGYVTPASNAYVRLGSGSFVHVATGVRHLLLAADPSSPSLSLEGYVGQAGRAFVRQGLSGSFHEVGPNEKGAVSDLSLALVGQVATPLVAYVTGGNAYVVDGAGTPLLESDGVQQVEVAAGQNQHGFPILAVENAAGAWSAKDGSLSSRFISEAAAGQLSLGTLVVS